MDKIDWKQKLSSRKFWALVAGLITAVLTAFNASDNTVLQVTAVVASVGSVAIYMLSEAIVDANRITYVEMPEEDNTNEDN